MNFEQQDLQQQLREEAYWSQGTREHRAFDLASANYYGDPNGQHQSHYPSFGFRDEGAQLPRNYFEADPRYSFNAQPGGTNQLSSLQMQASNSTNCLTSDDGQQNQYSTSSGGDQLGGDFGGSSLNQLGGGYSGSSDQQTECGGDDESLSWLTNGLMTRIYGEQKPVAPDASQHRAAQADASQLPQPLQEDLDMPSATSNPPAYSSQQQQMSLGANAAAAAASNQQLLPNVKLSSRDLLGLQGCYGEPTSAWQYPQLRMPEQLVKQEQLEELTQQPLNVTLKREGLSQGALGDACGAAGAGPGMAKHCGTPEAGQAAKLQRTPSMQAVAPQQQQQHMEQARGGHGGDFWVTRAESLKRYQGKKDRRLFAKTIRYEKRKANADKRPRVKGRFVKSAVGAEDSPGAVGSLSLDALELPSQAQGSGLNDSEPSEDTAPRLDLL